MKSMKMAVFGTTVLGFILIFSGVACSASLKIGLIDSPRVLKESKAAQEYKEVLMNDLKTKRAVFSKKQAEVLEMESNLKIEQAGLSSDELKDKQEALAKELKNLRRLKVDLEEELEKRNNEYTRQIVTDVREVVKEYREEENYTLIIEKSSVIASDDDIDITEDIIKLYDKAYGKK